MSIDRIGAHSPITETAPSENSRDADLRKVSKDLEAVFVTELMKAMRETIPENGLTNGGMGEDIFTSMLDQNLSTAIGQDWQGGIGEALYRQLRSGLHGGSNSEGGPK